MPFSLVSTNAFLEKVNGSIVFGDNLIVYLANNVAIAALLWVNPNLIPKQILGPSPNPKNA